MKKTFAPSNKDIKRNWVFIDAKDRVLGTVAAEAATKLMGKNKATFTPNMNMGDKVVIVNASKAVVTGNKLETKTYYWHTGYPKGLRSETLGHLLSRKPTEALKRAIAGMLPKNKLQKERMANLYIYADEKHPHLAQKKETN